MTPTAAAIVLAGGSGTRLGGARNKVHLPVAGRPVIAWSLELFTGSPGIGAVVLVVRDEDRPLVAGLDPAVELVIGGASRQDSELAGLRRLADRIGSGAIDTVLVHDGARPLATPALVAEVLRVARECGGAVPGLPRGDLATVGGAGRASRGLGGPAPAGLVAVQTPQGFRAAALLAAYEEAARTGFAGTDTASCMARFAPDVPVRAVAGEQRNIKITYPFDLRVAEHVLARRSTRRPDRCSRPTDRRIR